MNAINYCDALLDIAKTAIYSIINKDPVFQKIVEKLRDILGIDNCVIFKIENNREDDGQFLRTVASIPSYCWHRINYRGNINSHPDIRIALERKEATLIADPLNSDLTKYFLDIIIADNISQILYIPLYNDEKFGIIVNNAINGEKFEPEEIKFCEKIGEYISLILCHEEILSERVKDQMRNPIVVFGGYVMRLEKFSRELARITEEILNKPQPEKIKDCISYFNAYVTILNKLIPEILKDTADIIFETQRIEKIFNDS